MVLDDPAPVPALGFGDYAVSIAELITRSRAEFAVGIFGSWGSGKTTLMRAVRAQLTGDDVVTVWFNAWRYERDPHLIIPLLDVLREVLQGSSSPWARDAAVSVGRAGRALLAGVKLSVDAIPGLRIELDPDKVMAEIRKSNGKGPLSFYHAGFTLLQQSIASISAGGARRVVIFVDDLDRCLPETALELLESMKLLFGVPGCVFVAALDQKIVNKAIAIKYGVGSEVSGEEYIKKIFQVPFTVPQPGISQLPDYLDDIEAAAGFGEAQLADFREHVRPHFRFLAEEGTINPREVKLLINTYVLQLKVLSSRLGDDLDPDVALALLCMSSRQDWRPCHDQLAAEPQVVQPLLRDAARSPGEAGDVWLPGAAEPVPLSLLRYLSDVAWPLLQVRDLRQYLIVAESTWSADPWIPQARIMAVRLRRSADEAISRQAPEPVASLVRGAQDLRDFIARQRDMAGSLRGIWRDLEETASQIVACLNEPTTDAELLRARLTAMFDRLEAGLRDWQRNALAAARDVNRSCYHAVFGVRVGALVAECEFDISAGDVEGAEPVPGPFVAAQSDRDIGKPRCRRAGAVLDGVVRRARGMAGRRGRVVRPHGAGGLAAD